MGEQRIQEVTMFALLFLFLGILLLLVAAGRIWIDATPIDSPAIDSALSANRGESASLKDITDGRDSVSS